MRLYVKTAFPLPCVCFFLKNKKNKIKDRRKKKGRKLMILQERNDVSVFL